MIPVNSEIRFETTNLCNYSCCICPREKLTRWKGTMDNKLFFDLLDKILAESSQYKICTFSGFGEPFLDEGIFEKIKYARNKGLEVLMLTNASLLNAEKFKTLDDLGVSSLRVSFYGASRETYQKMHNVKNADIFDKIEKVLCHVSRIRRNTRLILSYNIGKGINDDDVEKWIAFWKDRTDLLEVWRPHNWIDGREYRVVQSEKLKTCGRPFNTPLQVQVDGTVNMCCFDFNGQLELGDLRTMTLEEIFKSPRYLKIRSCHESGEYEGSGLICENCDQRNKDKSDVMVYNSKYDIKERVKQVSTTYSNVIDGRERLLRPPVADSQ
ncbi:MAG: SPASM domain-containing protein [Candidatus Omnitrophica bacterium]|nr:SPASM domain-containing protein [Candidatus Omnitrophota bacterium]